MARDTKASRDAAANAAKNKIEKLEQRLDDAQRCAKTHYATSQQLRAEIADQKKEIERLVNVNCRRVTFIRNLAEQMRQETR